ncbi:heme exporter protein CcmD [Achromobacter pulmonis]|jgi:heme exporter protein CcmD|uniref:Heme exporter protein D n=1 Tax=Achromobacter pulmonis TaxID=1389932 RepID=A0A2N8KQ53_9BURK|nr:MULTISPECIES: heme exporter protein CcmD [Achromobacter]PND35578.1 heme exporter protein CcmD [Achromobacter pulmonis]
MSWDALFSMQGHGPYLLGAYGVTLALIGVEAFVLWRRARARRAARQAQPGGGRP